MSKISYSEAARRFEPRTTREVMLKKKCKLAVGSEKGTCPCEHPNQCQLIKILSEEHEDDEVDAE